MRAALAIPAIPVATDRVDLRLGREPLLDGGGAVRRQHVDHRAAFEVHHDRAVGQPFALGPLVDADHTGAPDRRARTRLHPPHDGVIAD